MWRNYVMEKIAEETKRIDYRAKLRKQPNCDHQPSLKSNCAQCRKLFWMYHSEKCAKQEMKIGMVNVPKSER